MNWAPITLLVAMSQAEIVRGSKGVCESKQYRVRRLADKKRPLDEVRDFSHARQALKDLGGK